MQPASGELGWRQDALILALSLGGTSQAGARLKVDLGSLVRLQCTSIRALEIKPPNWTASPDSHMG